MSEQVTTYIVPKDMAWDVETHSKAMPHEQLMVLATDYDAMHAEAEALRAENGRLLLENDGHNQRRIRNQAETKRLRTELEAALVALQKIARIPGDSINFHPSHMSRIARQALTATPAPEVRQDESLDDRLKQAGMLSVAELLKGAPLDAFIKHAGVHDLASLLQWAEMRRGECLRMMARYDLGEKDKGDDLYEWTVAHCAVFTELHVNLRAALVGQGERQEAVARDTLRKRFSEIEDEVMRGKHSAMSCFTAMRTAALYTAPQPGPDVRGLVEALEHYAGCGKSGNVARVALATHRQAKRQT